MSMEHEFILWKPVRCGFLLRDSFHDKTVLYVGRSLNEAIRRHRRRFGLKGIRLERLKMA